jgi:hypothetical protein
MELLMTRQEAFDTVARKMLAQGDVAFSAGLCRYITQDGRRCAIGHLLSEEDAKYWTKRWLWEPRQYFSSLSSGLHARRPEFLFGFAARPRHLRKSKKLQKQLHILYEASGKQIRSIN